MSKLSPNVLNQLRRKVSVDKSNYGANWSDLLQSPPMVVLLTGFCRFNGKSYDEKIEETLNRIKAQNSLICNIVDISEEMTEFVNNFSGKVNYNPDIPFHREVVLTDLYRLIAMKKFHHNLTVKGNYDVRIGWIDADLILTDNFDLTHNTAFCRVVTKRKDYVDMSLSNGLMYTNNIDLIDRWIKVFEYDESVDTVDFSNFSRGFIKSLMTENRGNPYGIKCLGDVISFTSYHDTKQWDHDHNLLLDSIKNDSGSLVGYNLSLSWHPKEIDYLLSKVTEK